MESLVKDLRFSLRILVKSPLVTGAALLSLALGIGANTTVFSLVNAIFLRGLPIAEPERVVALFTTEEPEQMGGLMPVSRPNYLDLRARSGVFSDLVDVLFTGANLSADEGEAEPVGIQLVTSNYFSALGIQPAAGTFFLDHGNDEVPGSEPVAVLSHGFWTERFGGDPDVVGRTLRLNQDVFTVLGVAPRGFNGTFVLGGPDLWVPVSMHEVLLSGFVAENFDSRRGLVTAVYGRLLEGVSIEQAQAGVSALGASLREQYPIANENRGFELVPVSEAALGVNQRDGFVRAGGLLMAVVGLVLFVACANVANLLLGRAAARRREIGIRLALGASRGRLVQQLLIESLALAALAGALGLAFAWWARQALWSMRPPFLAQSPLDLSFDPRVLGFTTLVALITGLLFGLAPAIRFSRPGIVQDLRQAADQAVGAGKVFSFRSLLVMAQVALSLVALVGSGLFLRSFGAALEVDLGFRPESTASTRLDLARVGYTEPAGEDFFTRALEAAQSMPGVEAASLTTVMPLGGGGLQRTVIVEGRADDAENNRILTPVTTIGAGFFETLGIRLVEGRDLGEADRVDSLAVVVINEAMAQRFWPGEQPLGQRFHFIGQDVVREVVGVVADAKYLTIGEVAQPQVYLPRRQNYQPQMALVLRADRDPESVLATVQREIRAQDPRVPAGAIVTGTVRLRQGLWATRMGASLLGVLSALALVLAAIGIYGVTSTTVAQREREISVRMALGANRAMILRLILSQGMRVVLLGLVLGCGLALAGARTISSLLIGVLPTDVVTYGATVAVLVAVAFVANLVPATRATAVDPSRGLRFER